MPLYIKYEYVYAKMYQKSFINLYLQTGLTKPNPTSKLHKDFSGKQTISLISDDEILLSMETKDGTFYLEASIKNGVKQVFNMK